jgi:hypothetical protein
MTPDEIMALEGRELDAAVANEVMGGSPVKVGPAFGPGSDKAHWKDLQGDYCWNEPWDSYPGFHTVSIPHYSTDYNAAAEVRARMCELYGGYEWLISQDGGSWGVAFGDANDITGHNAFSCVNTSETIAVCRVALLAKAALG